MKTIIMVSRGGLGTMKAASMLAAAAIQNNFFAHAMPEFSAERRGAKTHFYVRISEKPIYQRYKIIGQTDILVCFESSLIDDAVIKEGGLLVINSPGQKAAPHHDTIFVDATAIAEELKILSPEGLLLGNTAILGALLTRLPEAPLTTLTQIIKEEFGGEKGELNARAAERGFNEARFIAKDNSLPTPNKKSVRQERRGQFAISTRSTRKNKTGLWRTSRPVFTENCTACDVCALFCPENAIRKNSAGKMIIDYDYCKGCDICLIECPLKNRGIIIMPEKGNK